MPALIPRRWRSKAVLAIPEPVYGTDAAPTGAANAMLALEVELTPLEGGEAERDAAKPFLGADESFLTETRVQLAFSTELAGGGAADAPPKWGPLARACGLAETITPTSGPVDYDPVSSAFEGASVYINVDGTLHKLLGARGTATVQLTMQQIPVIRWELTGLFVAVADAALPAADFTGWQKPLIANAANTPTFTLFGTALNLESLEIGLGNEVAFDAPVGDERVLILDRKATGTLVADAVDLATFDPWAQAVARATGALSLVHGTAAGNTVTISAPKVQLGRPSYARRQDKLVTWSIPITLLPSDAGDDEIRISTQ